MNRDDDLGEPIAGKPARRGVENAANRCPNTRNAASGYHKVEGHSQARGRLAALVPIDFGDELTPPPAPASRTSSYTRGTESVSAGAVSASASISTRGARQSRLHLPGPHAEPLARMARRLTGHRPLAGRAAFLIAAIGERLTRDRAGFQDPPASPPRSAPDAPPPAGVNRSKQEPASELNHGRKKLGSSGRRSRMRLP